MSTLFSSAATAASAASSNTLGTLEKDMALSAPPEDSISDISFTQLNNNDIVAVSSWDNKVRLYQISSDGSSALAHTYQHQSPVFGVDWSLDGSKLCSVGADKNVRVCDLSSGAPVDNVIGMHDAPVRSVRWFDHNGTPMIATGSWDKTVRYWDLRQQGPAGVLQCQERVYTMDVRNQLLVIGTADRYIDMVNLNEPSKFYKTTQSTLKWQTRVLSCFNDASGFAVGSIEGRCAMQYVEEKDQAANFSFKCHRDNPSGTPVSVYAVNDISFHPIHGTFSTAGADGMYNFWDKDAKHRLKGYPTVGGSITATAFNRSGTCFAYAISYDWSKGYQANNTGYPTKVMLHPIIGDECKPRPPALKKK